MNKKITLYTLLFLALYGCKKFEHPPVENVNGTVGKISNVKVINLPGGAKIQYSLPKEENLLYVMAEFNQSGKKRKAIASLYSNQLTIQGFDDTLTHEIELYTVDKSENKSNPVKIMIHPKIPPIQTVFNTIQIEPAFGGIRMALDNPEENGYVVNLLIDSNDVWKRANWFFTALKNKIYFVRGLKNIPTKFGIYITDKWNNHSDTLIKKLTPLFEEELDKTQWKLKVLPSDVQTPSPPLTRLFNGSFDDFGQTKSNGQLPESFTVDLGAKYELSRMKLFERGPITSRAYKFANPKKYYIWGSNTLSDDWNDWTLLMKCESVKPSGLPYGQKTSEDVAYMNNGEENIFPFNTPAVRYIRFQVVESWAGTGNFYFAEFTLWGQKIN